MKKYLTRLWTAAYDLNRRNILSLLEPNADSRLLDLGCDDGVLTMELADKIRTRDVHGVEIVPERAALAKRRGITVHAFDLNERFDLPDENFDVVHSNQVIEHLWNTDNFLAETYRILRPGGYAVISTENASSWCNVAASMLGWQMFSLTNFSGQRLGIGNPLAVYRDEPVTHPSWNHVRILSIRGLHEYVEAFDFTVDGLTGAGYFPFPSSWGKVDRIHSHFITVKARRPR